MAYPTSLDTFSTKVDNVDDAMAAHMNAVQTAVAAIETELGTTPHTPNDTTAPAAGAADVKAVLSMMANALKTIQGNVNWYDTPRMPFRNVLGINMEGGTIALSTTSYLGFFGSGTPKTAPGVVYIVAPYAGVAKKIIVRLATAQPASGALTVTFYVSGATTSLAVTIPLSSAAGTYSYSIDVAVAANALMCVQAVNAATGVSGQIAGIDVEFDVA